MSQSSIPPESQAHFTRAGQQGLIPVRTWVKGPERGRGCSAHGAMTKCPTGGQTRRFFRPSTLVSEAYLLLPHSIGSVKRPGGWQFLDWSLNPHSLSYSVRKFYGSPSAPPLPSVKFLPQLPISSISSG